MAGRSFLFTLARGGVPLTALQACLGMRLWRHSIVALAAGMGMACAHATLITFDDLPPPAFPGDFATTPVTNEYASLGLIVNEGYLAGSGVAGSNQSLYGAPYLSLSFVDSTLPTYVSLYVSAPAHDKVGVDASGPNGWGASFTTEGLGGPVDTEYRPNQYVSFHSASGISRLDLSAFYFLRTGPVIDNLYFGNVAPVPEPGVLTLLAAGGLTLAAVRRRNRQPAA